MLPGEEPRRWADVDPAAVSQFWAELATPIAGAELCARLQGRPSAVERFLSALLDSPLVVSGTLDQLSFASSPRESPIDGYKCHRLILGITGAVQAVLMPSEIRRLQAFAEQIDVVLTRTARRFLRPRALRTLGVTVWCDPFDSRTRVPHIDLATSAELVVVLPATANVIFRLAHGACSDLLSLVVSATRAPTVIVPSMNEAMWRHPAVQRNLELLRGDGMFVVEPGRGSVMAVGATHQLGAIGLGPSGANLISTLRAILRLNR